jgi:predicted small secreted protein
MRRIIIGIVLASALLAGCAQTQPVATAGTAAHRAAPAKCSACHLPPQEHSLAADRWERYLRNHKRRLRLTEEEKAFLYDFLVGGTLPTASTSSSVPSVFPRSFARYSPMSRSLPDFDGS